MFANKSTICFLVVPLVNFPEVTVKHSTHSSFTVHSINMTSQHALVAYKLHNTAAVRLLHGLPASATGTTSYRHSNIYNATCQAGHTYTRMFPT